MLRRVSTDADGQANTHLPKETTRRHIIFQSTALSVVGEAIERAHRDAAHPVPEESSAECKFGYKHCAPEYRNFICYGLTI